MTDSSKTDSPVAYRLFSGVDADVCAEMLALALPRQLAKGELLLDPEQSNRHLYLVANGKLGLFADPHTHMALATIEAGECVGEFSVLGDNGAFAAVMALEASTVLAIPAEQLWVLMGRFPRVAYNLLQGLGKRLRQEHAALRANMEGRAALEMAATTDALTGMLNRRAMRDAFERELTRCLRKGDSVTLVMIDIDHFRQLNDTLGRRAGDRILAQLAAIIRQRMRPTDLLARYGGEEFCILLPQAGLQDAAVAAERLLAEVVRREGRLMGETSVTYTISAGVAQAGPQDSLESLLATADAALRKAKQSGRNRVGLAQPAAPPETSR